MRSAPLSSKPLRLSTAVAQFEVDFASRLHWSSETDAPIEQRVAAILPDGKHPGDPPVLGYSQPFSLGGLKAVKGLGVIQNRRVTALLHIGQDVGPGLPGSGVGVGRPMQAACEIHLKLRICSRQSEGFSRERGRTHVGALKL